MAGACAVIAWILVAPFYWHMTPKAMSRFMLSNGIQQHPVFPDAGRAPVTSTVAEAGERWSVTLYPGRVAVYRSEKFDVTVVARFSADDTMLGCQVFPDELRITQCAGP